MIPILLITTFVIILGLLVFFVQIYFTKRYRESFFEHFDKLPKNKASSKQKEILERARHAIFPVQVFNPKVHFAMKYFAKDNGFWDDLAKLKKSLMIKTALIIVGGVAVLVILLAFNY